MQYGYIRVSAKDQNIDRQKVELLKFGINEKNLFIDKQSGKDFEREKYQLLKNILKENDLLVIKSIDRLGRNYDMIIEEWRNITYKLKANIVVLDMPLLDTRDKDRNLTGKFVSDIVLQILSYVAETERQNIKQRQAEGIKIAKEKGVVFGRPLYKLPKNFKVIATKYNCKQISLNSALKATKMRKSTFYKKLKSIKKGDN